MKLKVLHGSRKIRWGSVLSNRMPCRESMRFFRFRPLVSNRPVFVLNVENHFEPFLRKSIN